MGTSRPNMSRLCNWSAQSLHRLRILSYQAHQHHWLKSPTTRTTLEMFQLLAVGSANNVERKRKVHFAVLVEGANLRRSTSGPFVAPKIVFIEVYVLYVSSRVN